VTAMSENEDLAGRFADLEARFAHQEETIQALSDMTAEQWEAIEGLRRQVGRLKDQLSAVEDESSTALSENQKPPHY